ncbi:MAG: hypothetical protein AAF517_18375, partial [Planctomycetota bacterium]
MRPLFLMIVVSSFPVAGFSQEPISIPGEFSALGKTRFEISGEFPAGTSVTVGGVQVDDLEISATRVIGSVPAYSGRLPLPVTVEVVASWRGGDQRFQDGVTYLGPLSVGSATSVSACFGGSADVEGVGFTRTTRVAIGGEIVERSDVEFLSARRLRVVAPSLAEGIYPVAGSDTHGSTGAAVEDALKDGMEYLPCGVEVTSFSPSIVEWSGGDELLVRGAGFTEEMRIALLDPDGRPFVELESEFVSSTLITAPLIVLEPGIFGVGLIADGNDPYVGPGRIRVVGEIVPAPSEIESSVVDGVAEISWFNPIAYQSIEVYRDGELHDTLPGDATVYRDLTPVSDAASYTLIGRMGGGAVGPADLLVAPFLCSPVANPTEGTRARKNFRILGGHLPLSIDPIDFVPPDGLTIDDVRPVQGDGIFDLVSWNPQVGKPLINFDPSVLTKVLSPNELVSGFRLTEPASKLRVAVHATKMELGPNVSLRARIESADENSAWNPVELTFPVLRVRPNGSWIVIDYNTQNPAPEGQPVPDPNAESPEDPHEPLPPGLYRIVLYAVGGEYGQSYYHVSSDSSNDQIFIPGVGCPPYPLVRVEPTNNFNPTIHRVKQVPIGRGEDVRERSIRFPGQKEPTLLVEAKIQAVASDLDGDLITNYSWQVDTGLGLQSIESASNSVTLFFGGYGTFSVDLEVWDIRCGQTKRRTIPVTIKPPCISVTNPPHINFPSPTPDRLHVVTRLDTVDSFDGDVMQEFKVFVTDSCEGPATTQYVQVGLFRQGGPDDRRCSGPDNGAVQYQSAFLLGVGDNGPCRVVQFTGTPGIGLDHLGKDCRFDFQSGGRFWAADFDLNSLPPVDPGGFAAEGVYELWSRGHPSENADPTNCASEGGWNLWRKVMTWRRDDVGEFENIWVPNPQSALLNVY